MKTCKRGHTREDSDKRCSKCARICIDAWRARNKEHVAKYDAGRREEQAQWREDHKEIRQTYSADYYRSHKEAYKSYDAKRKKFNKASIEKASLKWRQKNPGYTTRYTKARSEADIGFKLARRLRTRVRNALKGGYKAGSSVRDLGCSIPELKVYFEVRFQPGMSWENYGKWHIDHIKPLSSFDLTDREQFLEACHYTNLQPLWARDNISKGGKRIQREG